MNINMDMMHVQNQLHNADGLSRRISTIQETRVGTSDEERQAIKDAAETFESYFIQIMLREMRRTIPDGDGIIPRGQAERIFTEMLDEELSNEMARSGGIGLSQVIVQQLTRDSYMSNMR